MEDFAGYFNTSNKMGTLEANDTKTENSQTPVPMDTSKSAPAKASESRELTGEEQALYDRQIRLWGLEAQQRLASSNILLLGDVTSLVAQELAKNCVLAGVAKFTFMPGEKSETKKVTHAFLGDSLETIIRNLKDMNPHVLIESCKEDFSVISTASVACAIGYTREQELKLSDLCRAAKVPFFAGRVSGMVGWFFMDLGARYLFTDKSQDMLRRFCDYRSAIEAPWPTQRRGALFGWQFTSSLLEFERRHGRFPSNSGETKEKDVAAVVEIFETLRKEKGYAPRPREDVEKVKATLKRVAGTTQFSLAPVAAIVGGMWGREVTRVISRKGEPLRNFFYFDCETTSGVVERVGPQE